RETLHHREVDHAARRVLDRARLDPLGARLRRALHEEEVAGGAVRVALHHHRAVPHVGDERTGDIRVVLEEIALREPELWPEHLAEVGETDLSLAELEHGVVAVARNADVARHDRGPLASA